MTSDADAIQDLSSSDFIKVRLKHQFDIIGECDSSSGIHYKSRGTSDIATIH